MPGYFDLETLLRVPYVDPDLGFDVSPDGSKIAFSWNLTGRWEIYILDLERDAPPQQITANQGAKFSPRWSPDGQHLAYVLDLDGGENYDIYIFDLASGQSINFAPDTPEAINPSYAWSPDGGQIAFCADSAGRFDTYVKPVSGGQARKVLDQPCPDWEVLWSPDGARLAVVAEGSGQDYWTFIVPLEGGDPFPIAIDGESICAKDACWSPDGRRLAFASNLHSSFEIGIYEVETGAIVWLTSGEGEKEHPDWSPDGEQICYVLSHGPTTMLVIQSLSMESNKSYQIEPGVIYSPTFDSQGECIYLVFDNPRYPDDLWSFSLQESAFKQITHSLSSHIDQGTLTMPTEVRYPSLDGVEVPGLLYRPEGQASLPPGVLYIHGGPNWLTQITWDPLIQHMVGRGWVVLAPNYRGSTGYGREWQLASRFDLGGIDTADVVAGADYLRMQAFAAPDKIAVTGRSWGGYLTMTCLTQHPEKWAAGSAVVPFLNWFTSHANSREDLQHWDRENFGDPETNHDLWHERSPFFFLDRIQAPVQLICGAHDVRCPASESEQAYEQLTKLGKTCDYHLYLDEGHTFLKVANQISSKIQQANFFVQYLEGESC